MKNKSIDMLNSSLWKTIFIFALPLIFSNLLQVLFNMSDIVVVGKFGGKNSLGAVGSTTILVSLFTGLLIGMGSAVNAITAKRIGASDEVGVKKFIHSSLIIVFSFGLLLLVLGFLSGNALLRLLKTKDTFIDSATMYLQIYMLGMPALAIYNYGQGILSAEGKTIKPLIYLAIAGVVNIILNLILVIVFKLDVIGVAIASVVSQYLSMILILISLFRSKDVCKLEIKCLKTDRTCIKELLILGLAGGIQNSLFAISNLFIQSAVNSFDDATVSGNSAAQNFDSLVYDILAAFYIACSTFVGQNYGAGNKQRIKDAFLITVVYSFGIGLFIGLILFIFGDKCIRIFTDDPDLITAGLPRLKIMGLSYAISAFMDVPIAATRGLGKAFWPMAFEILGVCVLRIVWVYTVFAHFHTIASLYLLYSASWIVTGILETVYFIKTYKKVQYNHTNGAN